MTFNEKAPLSIGGALRAAAKKLEAFDTPLLDAKTLLKRAAGLSAADLIARANQELAPESAAEFDRLIARRMTNEPVAQITGVKEFWSMDFAVSRDVLTPRPDSEALISAAISRRDRFARLRILDLGTGSGCLLCALLSEFPNATGLGVDSSAAAIELAGKNAKSLGFETRAQFEIGNWGRDLAEKFDLIVSNPPYIPLSDRPRLAPDIRDFEPAEALFSGDDGGDDYRKILAGAPTQLACDGLMLIEAGDSAAQMLSGLGEGAFPDVDLEFVKDLTGAARCLVIDLAILKKNI